MVAGGDIRESGPGTAGARWGPAVAREGHRLLFLFRMHMSRAHLGCCPRFRFRMHMIMFWVFLSPHYLLYTLRIASLHPRRRVLHWRRRLRSDHHRHHYHRHGYHRQHRRRRSNSSRRHDRRRRRCCRHGRCLRRRRRHRDRPGGRRRRPCLHARDMRRHHRHRRHHGDGPRYHRDERHHHHRHCRWSDLRGAAMLSTVGRGRLLCQATAHGRRQCRHRCRHAQRHCRHRCGPRRHLLHRRRGCGRCSSLRHHRCKKI